MISHYRDDKNYLHEESYIMWDGKKIPVEFNFLSNTYECRPENTTAHSDELFSGTWDYPRENWTINKNKMILYIEDGSVFGCQYEELIFERVE